MREAHPPSLFSQVFTIMLDEKYREEASNLRRKIALAWSMADRASRTGAEGFLQNVVIDSRPEPRKYSEVAEGWQWQIARTIFPALEVVAKVRKGYTGPRSFWFTMPRGHDKTSLVGRLCGWTLAYARHRVSAIAAAADREQANLLAEFMETETKLNPWYAKKLSFKNYRVQGEDNFSDLKILASDAYGAYGLKPDLMVCDELTHWPKRDLWDSVMSGREKRPGAVFIIITNAGNIGSWQWELLNAAKDAQKKNGSWFVYEAPGPIASWMTAEKLEEQRAFLPAGVFRRVHMNEWLDPGEDCGFITRHEIELCKEIAGGAAPERRERGKTGVRYVAPIDYGPVKDRTACAVLHQEEDGTIVVDKMDVWQGSRDNPVPILDVEAWMSRVIREFGRVEFVVDPFQMESTIQKFEPRAIVERFEARGGKSNYEMAQSLRTVLLGKRLAWYEGMGDLVVRNRDGSTRVHSFEDELVELVIRPMGYGYRFDHHPGRHDDRVVCVGMGVWKLLRAPRMKSIISSDLFF